MTSKDLFQLSLDAKTRKIINQIPRGFKSEKIRGWIQQGALAEGMDITKTRGNPRRRESMTDLVRNL